MSYPLEITLLTLRLINTWMWYILKFELLYTDKSSNARAGLMTTDHGEIETPIFMPVGTVGSVKAVQMYELKEDIEAQIILGNT